MSQPPAYTRSFSYTDFSASYPTTPHPGTALDAECDAIAATAAGILANLVKIQRDDGALKNQIVTLDSLSPAVMLALGAGVIWLPRGAWVTATAYAVSDVVSSGTASYVCSAAHTSAALFATDVAAGRWTKLYDDAGSIPGDGTVTAAKIAAGAVTAAAIGFTGLDLSGSIRGASGLQSGTGTTGEALHVKRAAGGVLAKFERTTDDQGAVGYRVIGVTVTWEMSQPISGDSFDVRRNSVLVASFTDELGLDVSGTIRAVAGVVPAAGAGIGLTYVAGTGYLNAYDYTATAWLPMKLRGSTVILAAGGVDVATVTAVGIDFTGTVTRGGIALGWLDVPQNIQSAAYTLQLSDRGKHIFSRNVAGQTIVVPTNAAVAFPVGSIVTIVNDGTNPIAISTAGAIGMSFAGTALQGDRTLSVRGMATLLKVEGDYWYISGPGVS